MRYRISYDVTHGFWVDADSPKEAVALGQAWADLDYPGIKVHAKETA